MAGTTGSPPIKSAGCPDPAMTLCASIGMEGGLVPSPDRRRLVDDLAHVRGALFRSLQILEDQREGGSAALLLDGEAGTGNEASSEVDVLYFPTRHIV